MITPPTTHRAPRRRTTFRRPRHAHDEAGFNVLELLVIIAVIGLIAVVTIPAVLDTIRRTKIMNAAENIRSTLSRARSEAVRRGEDVTVTADLVENELVTTDGDGDVIARLRLPTASEDSGKIQFWNAADSTPGTADAVTGFTDEKVVFGSDGAAEETGSIFLAMGSYPRSEPAANDYSRNYLELRLAVRSTPRIEIRKWVPSAAAYELKTVGSSGSNWEWY